MYVYAPMYRGARLYVCMYACLFVYMYNMCVIMHIREKDQNLSESCFVLPKIMLLPLYSLMKSMQLELKGMHTHTHTECLYLIHCSIIANNYIRNPILFGSLLCTKWKCGIYIKL